MNEDLWALLEENAPSSASYSTLTGTTALSRDFEIELSAYTQACDWEEAKSFSDIAIVTFGAAGGEGSDFERAADGSSNSLELNENELALLEKLDEEGFTVITLINSSAVMELGPVIEHSDAILWIGSMGVYGTVGVVNILTGEANPSGRLVDTWMYAQETSSTYYTALYTSDSQYNVASASSYVSYANYNEGIYVGYRWYETADAEGYWDGYTDENAPEGAEGYDAVVAYPFGYGLSYTTFEESITSASYDELTGDLCPAMSVLYRSEDRIGDAD